MSEPVLPQFDPIIHPPHRLRICAALQPWDEYEFAGLRDVVGVSDSVLSKQLALLQSARYVVLRRANQNGRQRVWVQLTDLGREAFAGHVAALRDIVGSAAAAAAGNHDAAASPGRDTAASLASDVTASGGLDVTVSAPRTTEPVSPGR